MQNFLKSCFSLAILCLLFCGGLTFAQITSAPTGAVTPSVTGPSPGTFSSDALKATPSPQASREETRSLNEIYKEQQEHQRFSSPAYLMRVFGVLALILVAFYILSRTWLPRWAASRGLTTADPAAPAPKAGWLQRWMTVPPVIDAALKPRVLSRTRIGPAREIMVIEVGGKRLVVGATPHAMNLLSELPADGSESAEKILD